MPKKTRKKKNEDDDIVKYMQKIRDEEAAEEKIQRRKTLKYVLVMFLALGILYSVGMSCFFKTMRRNVATKHFVIHWDGKEILAHSYHFSGDAGLFGGSKPHLNINTCGGKSLLIANADATIIRKSGGCP